MLKAMINDSDDLREECNVGADITMEAIYLISILGTRWVVFHACFRAYQDGSPSQILLAS